jgi:Nickel responsive protein SCO4226-like
MQMYAIMRRHVCSSREELDAAGDRSDAVRNGEMAGQMRWIRSYFFHEEDGSLGTICVYESESAEAIGEHSARARIPADEVLPVFETVVAHPDPAPVTIP